MGGLPANQVPDGTTLFNIIERVGGTLGIGLLVSLFTAREKARVQKVALHLPLSSAQVLAAVNHPRHASAAVAHFVQNAEITGFHDVMAVIAH